jgi:adenylate cyclase
VIGTHAQVPSTGHNPGVEVRDFTTIYRRLHTAGAVANMAGALDLFAFTLLLLPVGSSSLDRVKLVVWNSVVFAVYMTFTILVTRQVLRRWMDEMRPWIGGRRPPTPAERDAVLRQPLAHARIAAGFWLGAAVVFTALNAVLAPSVAVGVAVVILLGGLTTSTVDYLLAERILRPVTIRALEAGLPDRPVGPGVGGRVTIVWLCATGVPLLGIAATAVAGIVRDDLHRGLFAAAVLFLAGLGAVVGLYATVVSTRAVSEPLAGVRSALARVESGDFGAHVPVDDASELGLVEAGVNRMAAGLRERERMRDLFGRHVGREVAMAALDGGTVRLGGEARCVGVMFVDMVGSTQLAQQLAPERVVALLNDFFALVVAVTESHGGLVNKFEGDGALCVFGAPVALEDPATPALAAARELRARLLDELPQVDAGIAVSAGDAVAGNVGAEQRFEYTVIGDPVNEAARLSDLAKQTPGRLLASDAAVLRAVAAEAARWDLGAPTVLRGRTRPTRIATLGSGRGGVRSKVPLTGG